MSTKSQTRRAGGAESGPGPASPRSASRGDPREDAPMSHKHYKAELQDLQVEFVKLQRHFIAHHERILVLLEGR